MPRKISKKGLIRKLDQEVSRIVRSRGSCARCRKTDNLQTAHIFSRSLRSVRWDLDNVLALCPNCHINFAHKCPVLFTEFVREYLGKVRYLQLKIKAGMIKKWQIWELQDLLTVLKTQ